MKILLADHFGLCFGVRDAIAQARDLAQVGPLTILGQLVHNPIVREQLQEHGVREADLDDTRAPSRRVMITAHGASDQRTAEWRVAGFDVFDGTCPLVRSAHDQLKKLVLAGYWPVVVGQQGHVEVRGLTGDFPHAAILETEAELRDLPRKARYGVISQTTQPIDHVHRLVQAIKTRYPEAEVQFVDTVCQPTKNRQIALRKLIAEAEVIVVVGGRASNNTRQLVATCQSASRRTIHIERPEELDAREFEGVEVVGLTAGTSTLRETVEQVQKRLEQMA